MTYAQLSKASKRKLLYANAFYWAAAIIVPPLLNLIPSSHPPRILPLFIFLYLITLASLSTLMWSRALEIAAEGTSSLPEEDNEESDHKAP